MPTIITSGYVFVVTTFTTIYIFKTSILASTFGAVHDFMTVSETGIISTLRADEPSNNIFHFDIALRAVHESILQNIGCGMNVQLSRNSPKLIIASIKRIIFIFSLLYDKMIVIFKTPTSRPNPRNHRLSFASCLSGGV